jgi:hypothetical protein
MTRSRLAAVLALCGAVALMTPVREALQDTVSPSDRRAEPTGQARSTSTRHDRTQSGLRETNGITGLGTVETAGPDSPGVDAAPVLGQPKGPQSKTVSPLTSKERAEARAIVARDKRVAQLLGNRPYAVSELAVWGTRAGQANGEKKVGASLVLSLRNPAALVGRWPLITYASGPKATRPYSIRTVYMNLRRVAEVGVNVNLTSGKVASIAPGDGSRFAKVPAAFKREAARHGESGD